MNISDNSLKARAAEKYSKLNEPALSGEYGTNGEEEFTEVAATEAMPTSSSDVEDASPSGTGCRGCWGKTTRKLKVKYFAALFKIRWNIAALLWQKEASDMPSKFELLMF